MQFRIMGKWKHGNTFLKHLCEENNLVLQEYQMVKRFENKHVVKVKKENAKLA